MTFDEWMLTKDESYVPTDDSMRLRLLRDCWFSRDAEIKSLRNQFTIAKWTAVVGRYHGKPGYENISTAFLLYCGNQIGNAMPLYVAKAAAEKLNEMGVEPEGW